MKTQLGATDMFFPVPAALIGCGTYETPNIITVASIGIVSSTPPTIGIALDKKRHSLELIRTTGEFTVNIPNASQFEKADYCGIVTGKKVDKFKGAAFEKMASHFVSAPLIKDCPFNLECRVTTEIQLGDYVLVLAEILETHVDESAVKYSGSKAAIDITLLDPLVYFATIREYRKIGNKLGEGFKAGLTIRDKEGGKA